MQAEDQRLFSVGGTGSYNAEKLLTLNPRLSAVQKAWQLLGNQNDRALAAELLNMCYGIDSCHLRFNPKTGDPEIDGSLAQYLPGAKRAMVLQICELGWLYRRVLTRINAVEIGANSKNIAMNNGQQNIPQNVSGGQLDQLVTKVKASILNQTLSAVIRHKLTEYTLLLAQLKAIIDGSNGSSLDGDDSWAPGELKRGQNYLTLRRLWVWLESSFDRMRLYALVLDSTNGLRGGALLRALWRLAMHGADDNSAVVRELHDIVARPLVQMIHKWVLYGEIEDPYGEFFIYRVVEQKASSSESGSVRSSIPGCMWQNKYAINNNALPPFINEQLALTTLRAGKSIDFLREFCQDQQWISDNLEGSDHFQNLANFTQEGLHSIVQSVVSKIDARVVQIVEDRFHFMKHCDALRRYLLGDEGDFLLALLDQLQSLVDSTIEREQRLVRQEGSYQQAIETRALRQITQNELNEVLHKAVHDSWARLDDEHIIDRLYLAKMKTITTLDSVWEVVGLRYSIRRERGGEDPLETVFTSEAMDLYMRLAYFQWKLHRIQFQLNGAIKGLMGSAKILNCGPLKNAYSATDTPVWQVLRRYILWCHSMRHICCAVSHYVSVEVVGGAWQTFTSGVESASNLDEIIQCHQNYLEDMVHRALLDRESQNLFGELQKLLDLHKEGLAFANNVSRLVAEMDGVCRARAAQREGQFWKVNSQELDQRYQGTLNNFYQQVENMERTFNIRHENFMDTVKSMASQRGLHYLLLVMQRAGYGF
eukprot:TRINITY_DN5692_c0_g1_i5.p1 TRINITY_DN5692_c0_g1~~TRINITY_DN5692_c0_g1_i5.p1  ORF type:complete len:764 (+),score=79.73 TRINITY_DN5692_c0_g1_i5:141-2432(+)